jgi:diaminohydroxyphosphoribosylaminopyrimidine deaminase/5-amino-6-(5-phosphoribosylamino)uracil reductase
VVSPTGEVLAKGYHRNYGALHAEREALKRLGWRAPGASLYVNLEPCCHYGKTPPCTEAIIEAGLARVVVGMVDPNPLVSGKGIEVLRKAGIGVEVGLLEEECRHLNRAFVHFVATNRPWVLVKWAQSLDGRIAVASGDSQWISCRESLRFAHRLRAEADAVMVGRGTVERDDCQLTVRLLKGRNPLRVVVDSKLSLSPDKRVFSPEVPTVLYTVSDDVERMSSFRMKGVEVVVLATTSSR